jgi:hypothetical protein
MMLLQTNSYIVPKDKRTEHSRLIVRFRQTLARLGCDHFEAYEQVGANWSPTEATGRFVQIMRFRDRKHQQQVQAAERSDPGAQALIKEFCELINFPYQQQQGLFAVGFYTSVLPAATPRIPPQQRPDNTAQSAPSGQARLTTPPTSASTPEAALPAAEVDDDDQADLRTLSAADTSPPADAESLAEEVLLSDNEPHVSPESDSNGELRLDDADDEASRPKDQPRESDRAMQYDP